VQTYEAHKTDGFVVLGVNDTTQDTRADSQAFVQEFHLAFPILLDEEGRVTDGLYRLIGLPMSVFINPDGMITRIYIGALTVRQLNDYVKEIHP
jgi:peroxiredoxin